MTPYERKLLSALGLVFLVLLSASFYFHFKHQVILSVSPRGVTHAT